MTNGFDSTDRLPPHSRESERALLGSIMREPHIIHDVAAMVRADEFYVFGHQKVFTEALRLAEKGKPVDVVTIAEALMKSKSMDDVGGHGYLAELFDGAPSAAHYVQYAEAIREFACKRSIILACVDMQAGAYDPSEEAADLLSRAERTMSDLSERVTTGEPTTLQQGMVDVWNRMQGRKDGTLGAGIPTGYLDVDEIITGLQDSELTLLAARPSVGKTALALNIASHVASSGIPVLFVSLEQSKTELLERMVCCEARVDSYLVKTGRISPDLTTKLMDAGDRMRDWPLLIDDLSPQGVQRIGAIARRMKRKYKIGLVIVDYIQLIEPEDRKKAEHEQISGISKRLKFLAKDLKIPVLALSQLNRESEAGAGRRPRLSDLRGSGTLEQDGDCVIMLHRPNKEERHHIEVLVEKNRNGRVGETSLMFDAAYTRFENAAKDWTGRTA